MSEIVNITDVNFRKCILRHLSKPSDYQITKEDCESILEIFCDNLGIKILDGIEYFTNLTVLLCNKNQLTSLDLSKNINLEILLCDNSQLTKLDLSNNIKLLELYCYRNKLISLDVSKNTYLKKIICHKNQLTSLDVSKNIKLRYLCCHNNPLTNLNLNKKNNNISLDSNAIITNFNTLKIRI